VIIGAVILVTAATLIGGGMLVALALRKLYKREGRSFADWHKRRLLAALALSIPILGAVIAIAIGFSLQSAELFLIAAGLSWEAFVIVKRRLGSARRGSPLPIGSFPKAKRDRLTPIFALLAAGLLVLSTLAEQSIGVLDIARFVALAQMATAAVFLIPVGQPLYDGGILELSGFVPWERFDSFRCTLFDRTAVFSFHLRAPGWFRKEVRVAVPKAEVEPVSRWLSTKLPCLGVQDVRNLPGGLP
jgi:hypothetical protein